MDLNEIINETICGMRGAVKDAVYEYSQLLQAVKIFLLFYKEDAFKKKALAFSKLDSSWRKSILETIQKHDPNWFSEAARAEACRLAAFRLEFLSHLEAGTEKKFLAGYDTDLLLLMSREISNEYHKAENPHSDNCVKMDETIEEKYLKKYPTPGERDLLKTLSHSNVSDEESVLLIENYLSEHAIDVPKCSIDMNQSSLIHSLEVSQRVLARSHKNSDVELSEKLGRALEVIKPQNKYFHITNTKQDVK